MKQSILKIVLFVFMVATISTSYGHNLDNKSVKANENNEDTANEKVDAKLDLKEAQKDSISEFKKFRKESELKIKSIDNSIGDLKVKFYKSKIKDKEAYQDNLNLLEQKNDELKKKLADYNANVQNTWTAFKLEFNHDLVELGKAMKEFTAKNKK